MSEKVYTIVTEKIIALLDKGVVPWHKPWKTSDAPRSLDDRAYSGVNAWLLNAQASFCNYPLNIWGTFNTVKAHGGYVRRGEKSMPIILWKGEKKNEQGERIKPPYMTYFSVFNVAQCDGLEIEQADEKPLESIETADEIVTRYFAQLTSPSLFYGGDRAAYSPARDSVMMPPPADFTGSPEFYSTLFHEMAHSTGHKTRLAREGIVNHINFGSHEYSKEELVAEMSAAFLCGRSGIESTFENSAAYIASWREKLAADKYVVVRAASQADKAVRFISGELEREDQVKE